MDKPTKVYHYTTLNTALEHILNDKTIRFGSLGLTNDPRETKEWGFAIMDPPLEENNISHTITLSEDLNQRANKIRTNEWFVFCTSCNEPKRRSKRSKSRITELYKFGYSRPRMWAQYAGNHTGVCLEFSYQKLNKSIISNLAEACNLFSGHVEYDRDYDGVNYRNSEKMWAYQISYPGLSDLGLDNGLRDHIINHYDAFFLTKDIDWETEFEFRWLIHSPIIEGPFFFDISDSISSVLVGTDFPSVYEPTLIKLCEELNVPAGRMSWRNRKPSAHFGSIYQPIS